MPFLDQFFGKPAQNQGQQKSKAEVAHEAIVKMKTQIQTMEKRETHMERQIEQVMKSAKEAMKNNNKKRALQFLKKKKMLEKQLDATANKRLNLETLLMNLEEAQMNTEVVSGMKVGGNDQFHLRLNKHCPFLSGSDKDCSGERGGCGRLA